MAAQPVIGDASGSDGPEPSASALRTRVVAAGVEQIVADSVGHRLDRGQVREVAIDDAGTIWLAVGRDIIELGRAGSIEPRRDHPQQYLRRLEVTPGGELWAEEDGGAVVRLEDGRLRDRTGDRRTVGPSITALDDGLVWRIGRRDHASRPLAWSEPRGWDPLPSSGLGPLLGSGSATFTLARTADDRTWLGADGGPRGGGLAALDGPTWEVARPKPDRPSLRVRAMTAADDGTLWVLTEIGPPGPRSRLALIEQRPEGARMMAAAAGMPQRRAAVWTAWSPLEPAALTADATGRVWFSLDGIGLWTYDRADFVRVDVPGLRAGVLDLAMAPDGSIWAVSRGGALYRLCGSAPTCAGDRAP